MTFYNDYKDEIKSVTLVHVNRIFSGLILKTDSEKAYIVELDTTVPNHPNPKEGVGLILDFSPSRIGKSIIDNVRLN